MLINSDYKFKSKENEQIANILCDLANGYIHIKRSSLMLYEINKDEFNTLGILEKLYYEFKLYWDELYEKEHVNLANIFIDVPYWIEQRGKLNE